MVESSIIDSDEKKEKSSDTFVAIDIGKLSHQFFPAADIDAVAASPRPPLMKNLSRKGIQRGEKKSSTAAAAADGEIVLHQNSGGAGGSEKGTPLVHVAVDGEIAGVVPGTPGGGRRRGRRPAPWLDPKRVLFLFATLSSIGTLILLYFTLSMGKNDSGDTNTNTNEW